MDRLGILVEVLGGYVADAAKGSMYAPMLKPAIGFFARKISELADDEKAKYLGLVQAFSNAANREDLSEADYRSMLVNFIDEIKNTKAVPV